MSIHPPESLDQLLELHDARFVRAAYLSVLGRPSDPVGHANYLRRVRSGVAKSDIVRELATSPEGVKAVRRLRGLDEFLRSSARLGPTRLAHLAARLWSLLPGPTSRRLGAVENAVGALSSESLERLTELQRAIVRMESRLALSVERLAAQDARAVGTPALDADGKTLAERTHSSSPLILEFEYGRTASPASIGKSPDSRELALGMIEMEVFDVHSGASLHKLDLREGGNASSSVLFGFSNPEPWGTWSSGGKSALALWLKAPAHSGLRIELRSTVFADAFQSVDITVQTSMGHWGTTTIFNGVEKAQIVLDAPRSASARMFFGPISSESDPLNLSMADATPVVSVIILNYNKPVLSMLSAMATVGSGIGVPYELIVVDNGSRDEQWHALQSINSVARLARIPVNRFFGEGNNIGAEGARGEYLLFLNNDAFPSEGCVDELLEAFQTNPDCGAASPVFVYPDGRMQEAGAFVRPDGSALQRGKGDTAFDPAQLPRFDKVDYGSAACLLIRKETFTRVGGFNYRYDPAYYEDTDLCLRLKLINRAVYLARDARCVHIENATTSDKKDNAGANRVVELNREVFLSLWAPYLASREPAALPTHILPDLSTEPRADAPLTQATYSPFPLTPGGGERYLLSTALALANFGETAFATADPYSRIRLDNVLTDLGLPTGRIRPAAWASVEADRLERLVVMGNEVLPRLRPTATHAYFHCQFPFPWHDIDDIDVNGALDALKDYRKVIVNSEFTKQAYLSALARYKASAPVDIVYPPVGTARLLRPSTTRKPQILSIGRFTDLGHNKRQDVLIAALKAAPAAFRKEWRLVLCGSIPNEPAAKKYFSDLRASVDGSIQVEFLISPSRETLDRLLLESAVYAHATGFGVTAPDEYWKCEHFGITMVEAIAAGCVTLAYEVGGGPEIVRATRGGATFGSLDQLVALLQSASVGGLPDDIRRCAHELFGDLAFADRMRSVLAS